jgi:hypothetical protein
MIGEARQRLDGALIRTVSLDHALALGRGREHRVQREARSATAKVLKRYRRAKLYGFEVIGATVVVAQALRRPNLIEGDAILVIAAVGPMHDKAPLATLGEWW